MGIAVNSNFLYMKRFSKLVVREIIDNVVWLLFWQCIFFLVCYVHNFSLLVKNSVISALLESWFHVLLSWELLIYLRIFIFETFFCEVPYVTPRKRTQRTERFQDHHIFIAITWTALGTLLLTEREKILHVPLSERDFAILLALFISVDFFFYWYHRIM